MVKKKKKTVSSCGECNVFGEKIKSVKKTKRNSINVGLIMTVDKNKCTVYLLCVYASRSGPPTRAALQPGFSSVDATEVMIIL